MARWFIFLAVGLMALFAELDPINKVLRVVVSPFASITGETYLAQLLGGRWKETTIDGSIRSTYVGPGYEYLSTLDIFSKKRAQSVAIVGDSLISNMAAQGSTFVPAVMNTWHNTGVGGKTTTDIIGQVALLGTTYTDIYVEGGINDMLFGQDANIIPNYKTIIESIDPANTIRVIGIYPIDDAAIASLSPTWLPMLTNSKVAAKNAEIVSLCANYPNCKVINAAMSRSNVGQTIDGLHWQLTNYAAQGTLLVTALSQ